MGARKKIESWLKIKTPEGGNKSSHPDTIKFQPDTVKLQPDTVKFNPDTVAEKTERKSDKLPGRDKRVGYGNILESEGTKKNKTPKGGKFTSSEQGIFKFITTGAVKTKVRNFQDSQIDGSVH